MKIAADIFRTAAELRGIIGEHPELRVIGDPFFNVAFCAAPSGEVDIFHVNDYSGEAELADERPAAPAGGPLLHHPTEHRRPV